MELFNGFSGKESNIKMDKEEKMFFYFIIIIIQADIGGKCYYDKFTVYTFGLAL